MALSHPDRLKGRLPLPVAQRAAAGPAIPSLTVPLLVGSVVGLPLLLPRGIGNSVPVDGIMLLFAAIAIAFFWARRARVEVPLGASYLLIVLGGTLGILGSIAPAEAGAVVLQDLYLYIWFLAVVNLILLEGSERLVRLVVVAWGVTALAMAGVMVAIAWIYPNMLYLFGWPMATEYGRVMATFRDPNMAGNYLVISLFILWASPLPTRRLWKLLATIPILLAIYYTQSITALVALVAGVVVSVTVGVMRNGRIAIAAIFAVAALAVVLAAFIPRTYLEGPQETTRSIASSDMFSESLGRTDTSLSLRVVRWRHAFIAFGDDIVLGIGASTSDLALHERGFPTFGEIHNDFIAGFIERGLIGGIGVIALFVMVTRRALQVGVERSLRRSGWAPAALVGAIVTVIVSAISLETLHFRHVWMLFAVITALYLRSDRQPLQQPATGL